MTADGQRFLVNEFVRTEEPEPITLVVDWPAALKKKVTLQIRFAASAPTRSSRRWARAGWGRCTGRGTRGWSATSRSRSLPDRCRARPGAAWRASSARRRCWPRSTIRTSPRSTASSETRRRALPRAGARRGRGARRAARSAARSRFREALGSPARSRTRFRGGAREGSRPPRPEARQRARDARRAASRCSTSAWPRRVDEAAAGSAVVTLPGVDDRRRDDPRHAGLHEPRAGAGPHRRQADRPLVVRLSPLRDAVGRRAFAGETVPDCLAAILHDEPDWKRLPRATPAAVRRILRRCLEKDPEQRLRDAKDAQVEIQEAPAAGAPGAESPRARSSSSASAPRLTQLTLARGLEESPVFSPDGDEMAYAADHGRRSEDLRSPRGGGRRDGPHLGPLRRHPAVVVARRPNDRLRARPPEPTGSSSPGTSSAPTGAATSGPRSTSRPRRRSSSRTRTTRASRRTAPDRRSTRPGPASGASGSVDPHGPQPASSSRATPRRPSPTCARAGRPTGAGSSFRTWRARNSTCASSDLETQKLLWVTNDLFQDLQPVWSPSGRFIYFSSYRSGGLNLWRIAVSSGGKPRGAPQQMTTGAGQDVEPALSPDGARLAFAIRRQNADLWTLPVDPATGRPTGPPREAIATNREDSRGAWSPDGRSIAFNSDRGGRDEHLGPRPARWIEPPAHERARRRLSGQLVPGREARSRSSPRASGLSRHLDGRRRLGRARAADRNALARHQSRSSRPTAARSPSSPTAAAGSRSG